MVMKRSAALATNHVKVKIVYVVQTTRPVPKVRGTGLVVVNQKTRATLI